MTKFTDGKRLIGVTAMFWSNELNIRCPDLSYELLQAGSLEKNEEMMAYIVDDVQHVIDYLNDWKNYEGNFWTDEYERQNLMDQDVIRTVWLDELQMEG